jgi:hypothetical protein
LELTKSVEKIPGYDIKIERYSNMERTDQGHLHPKLEAPDQTKAFDAGGENYRKSR